MRRLLVLMALLSGCKSKPGGPVSGEEVYARRCAACHQSNGQGQGKAYPALRGSPYVLGSHETAIRIVLDGLTGPITVNGITFDNAMPSQGVVLTDAEAAAVLTYARASWGNGADAITAEEVARERAKGRRSAWTAAELATGSPVAQPGSSGN